MKFEVSKIDVAVDQLDWAIRLFLDHKAYIPAITLAGAAEEILGKAVNREAAFITLKNKFVSELNMSEKEVTKDHLNMARNWLKHWDQCTHSEERILELDTEAMQYIVRSLINLATHDPSRLSEGLRFAAWITENGLWPSASPQ